MAQDDEVKILSEDVIAIEGTEGVNVKLTIGVANEADYQQVLAGVIIVSDKNPSQRKLSLENEDAPMIIRAMKGDTVDVIVPVIEDCETGIWLRGIAFRFRENGVCEVVYSSEYRRFWRDK